MPVSEYGNPYEPGSPEDEQFNRAAMHGAGLVASQWLPAWAAQLVPWSTDAQGNSGPALPGIVPGSYAAIGKSMPELANWASKKAGYGLNIPTAPGADRAAEMVGNNDRWADSVIPQVQPQNETEQHVADAARGGFAFALPGGELASGLGKVGSIATHVLLPGVGAGTRGALAGGAITSGYEATQDYERDKLIKQLGGDPDEVRKYREADEYGTQPPAQDLTQPDTTQTVAHPQAGAAANVPFPTSLNTSPTAMLSTSGEPEKYETLAAFGRPDIKITAPDFNTTGETGWDFAKGLAIGVGGLVAGVGLMRYGGKVLDPAIKTVMGDGDQINTAARRANFNAQQARIDAQGVLPTLDPANAGAVRGEAPLPGKAGTVMTNLAQNAYDDNRVLTEYGKAVAPDSGAAKQMEALLGTVNNSTPLMNSINEQMATGVNKANGNSIIPRLKTILQSYGELPPDKIAVVEKGLYAGDELDTRVLKTQAAMTKPGTVVQDEAIRHNFIYDHSDDLRAAHDAMMADPETAVIANQVYALQRANMVEAYEMGRVTKQVMDDTLRMRPNQIPSTNLEGFVDHALGKRDIDTTGWAAPPTRAVDALTQHYGKLYAELQHNRMMDQLLNSADRYQTATPGAAKVVTLLRDNNGKLIEPPTGSPVGRRIVTYNEGVPHVWEVDNTNLYNAMKGNIPRTHLLLNVADTLKQQLQAGTTGVSASVLGQRAFPVIALNRYIPQIGVDRFPGTTFGLVDKGVSKLSGGRFGLRTGIDPSQYIGSYAEAIKGIGHVTMRATADGLRDPSNIANITLRKLAGDPWVEGWAQRLNERWLQSSTAEMRAEGATGSTLGGTYQQPTFNISKSSREGYTGITNAVPSVFSTDGIKIPFSKIAIPGSPGVVRNYLHVRSFLRDIHEVISEGANAYYWKGLKENPNITPEQRAYYTRHVIGDPSVHGAGPIAQAVQHVPWINPTVQDITRMMRNLRDNPVSFTLGTVHTLGVLAAGQLFSAMLGGAKHINMMQRLMSTHDRASNVTIFHDPSDEHNYTQFSLPQRWRMLYPSILEAVATGMGSYSLHPDEPEFTRVMHALSDMFSHHISQSTTVATAQGVADTFDILQPPPYMQVAANAAGYKLNSPIAQGIENKLTGQPLNKDILVPNDAPSRVPGRGAASSYFSNDDSTWVHNMLRSILGAAANGLINGYDHVMSIGKGTGDLKHEIADAFSGMLHDYEQSWRDNASFGNSVWGNNMKMTKQTPMAVANDASFMRMKDLPKLSDLQLQGLTRAGGAAMPMPDHPKFSSDPMIVQMMAIKDNYLKSISTTIEPQLNDIKKELRALETDTGFAAQTKRELYNRTIAQKNDLEERKNLEIEKMNAALSQVAGNKHVNIMTLDASKGREQFHD